MHHRHVDFVVLEVFLSEYGVQLLLLVTVETFLNSAHVSGIYYKTGLEGDLGFVRLVPDERIVVLLLFQKFYLVNHDLLC